MTETIKPVTTGVDDVCIVVCDGLEGLPESITTGWRRATVKAASST